MLHRDPHTHQAQPSRPRRQPPLRSGPRTALGFGAGFPPSPSSLGTGLLGPRCAPIFAVPGVFAGFPATTLGARHQEGRGRLGTCRRRTRRGQAWASTRRAVGAGMGRSRWHRTQPHLRGQRSVSAHTRGRTCTPPTKGWAGPSKDAECCGSAVLWEVQDPWESGSPGPEPCSAST